MTPLEVEAHQLWERLVDRHNACFQHGMPLPNTAEIRARYRRMIAKASSRYIRRVVRPAIVRIRPEQVDMAPVDMDQLLVSCGLSGLLAIPVWIAESLPMRGGIVSITMADICKRAILKQSKTQRRARA